MKAAIGALAAVLIGLALFEVTMRPSGAERLELAAIFIVMAGLMIVAGAIVPRLARRSSRLVTSLFVVSVAAIGIALLGIVVAANRMFFSDHDLRLLLVVLGFGLVAALVFAALASSALTKDLQRIADTASRVAEGELTARTGVERHDEVGELADAVDVMASALEDSDRDRSLEEDRRRRFFAAVSHDLRTPLASMQAAVEALDDGVATDTARYYASLQRDIDVLHGLVDDLFLLARLESGDVNLERVPSDLSEIADEVFEALEPIATRRNVALVLEPRHSVVVETEPSAVSRVMRNLLDNAIRHAPDDSAVRVSIDADAGATVSVVDEGVGFGEDFVGSAFDSFSREDVSRTRETGGAGLGLAIARGLVDALGGDIWIDPGPGGKIAFRLP